MYRTIATKLSGLTRIVVDVAGKGFFHLLSSNILLRILGFGSQLLVVKLLTPTEMGQIKILQTYVEISLVLAGFGFNTATLVLCSNNTSAIARTDILIKNIMYAMVSSAFVLLALFVFSGIGWISADNIVNEYMRIFMLSIPALVVASIMTNYLQALKQVKKMATAQIYQKLAGIVAIVFLTYIYGLPGFILASVVIAYASLPLLYYYVKPLVCKGRGWFINNGNGVFKNSFYYAKWSTASNGAHQLTLFLDILMINYLVSDREGIGYYSIAVLFLIPLKEFTRTVRTISTPYFVEKKSNKKEFMRALNKYRRLMLLQSIGLSLLAVVVVPPFIRHFFGEQYSDVAMYFCIIVIGYVFHSYIALLPTALIALGKMKYNFFSTLIYFPLSLVVMFMLINQAGLVGAAIAHVVTSMIIMVVIIYVSKIGISRHFAEIKA